MSLGRRLAVPNLGRRPRRRAASIPAVAAALLFAADGLLAGVAAVFDDGFAGAPPFVPGGIDRRCLGTLWVTNADYDAEEPLQVISAKTNVGNQRAGKTDLLQDRNAIRIGMKGRAYFADTCHRTECDKEGSSLRFLEDRDCDADKNWQYDNREYSSLQLLGGFIKYQVDLSGAECGCNAAFYLVSMRQNDEISTCSDYYCDANAVCGVRCPEIDIMEANRHAFYSTLHGAKDGAGQGLGIGAARTTWAETEYGPGGKCVDTDKPFEVEARFPTEPSGRLKGMEVILTQEGSECPLQLMVDFYPGMAELERALADGMTPVMSYWGVGENILWMDGKVCSIDDASKCGDFLAFRHFSIGTLEEPWAHARASAAPAAGTTRSLEGSAATTPATTTASKDTTGAPSHTSTSGPSATQSTAPLTESTTSWASIGANSTEAPSSTAAAPSSTGNSSSSGSDSGSSSSGSDSRSGSRSSSSGMLPASTTAAPATPPATGNASATTPAAPPTTTASAAATRPTTSASTVAATTQPPTTTVRQTIRVLDAWPGWAREKLHGAREKLRGESESRTLTGSGFASESPTIGLAAVAQPPLAPAAPSASAAAAPVEGPDVVVTDAAQQLAGREEQQKAAASLAGPSSNSLSAAILVGFVACAAVLLAAVARIRDCESPRADSRDDGLLDGLMVHVPSALPGSTAETARRLCAEHFDGRSRGGFSSQPRWQQQGLAE